MEVITLEFDKNISELITRDTRPVKEVRCSVPVYIMDARIKESYHLNYSALISWNKVLTDDKTLLRHGYAYASRAMLFHGMRLYRQCLNNIALAYVHNLPEHQLRDCKESCERELRNMHHVYKPEQKVPFKLSFKANPRLPFMVDCLKLRLDSEMKHCVISDRNLKIGDVIAIESAFFSVSYNRDHRSELIETDLAHQRCYHCFNHNGMDLMPCHCCDLVMFCSWGCKIAAENMYHKYECLINTSIEDIQEIVRSMRPFFSSLYLFNDNIQDLQDFLLSRGNVKKTVFDYDMSDTTSCENALHLLHIFDSIDAPIEAIETDISMVISAIFECHPLLAAMWITHKDFIVSLVNRHNKIMRVAAGDLYQWPPNVNQLLTHKPQTNPVDLMINQKLVGTGCFLFSSMLNYSCISNVYRHINEDNKMCLIVSRNIMQGEKLTVSRKDALYFSRIPKEQRQRQLQLEFNFTCTTKECQGQQYAIPFFATELANEQQLSCLPNLLGYNIPYWCQTAARWEYSTIIKELRRNYYHMQSRDFLIQQKRAFMCLEFATQNFDCIN